MNARHVVALLLIALTLACGTGRSAQQRLDEDLLRDVRAKISEVHPDPVVIEVTVKDAVVILNGRVGSEEERRKIGDAANSVRGVKSVVNNIQSH